MLVPNSFAIHVTYTCPLACAHCCFKSSPAVKDKLPVETIAETIQCLDNRTIKMVAFTGGEPFLLGRELAALVRLAKNRGFTTRVVTSAYWGKNNSRALAQLIDLKNAGLDELSISWDDYHEEFISFACVYNAFWAAKQEDITVAINIVQDATSKWTRERVANELGVAYTSEIIVESSLNITGRADYALQEAVLKENNYIGPCPYVITGPTLSAKNKLLACCGVIPETDDLVVNTTFNPATLPDDLLKMQNSVLYKWLYLRGPYDVMQYIHNEYAVEIREKAEIGGNCEACKLLFTTQKIKSRIKDAIDQKAVEIENELYLLHSLGMLEPGIVQSIWSGQPA